MNPVDAQRLKIYYKVRTYAKGKEVKRDCIYRLNYK